MGIEQAQAPQTALLVAATWAEATPVAARLGLAVPPPVGRPTPCPGLKGASLLLTGIGPVNTAYWLALALAPKPNETPYYMAINFGVCGVFGQAAPLCTPLEVVREAYADLGAQKAEGGFLFLDEMNLPHFDLPNSEPAGRWLAHAFAGQTGLPRASGLTAATVHGEAGAIRAVEARFGIGSSADTFVETMEGAAFFQACLLAGRPFAAIRAGSNRVAPRDRAAWRLAEAAHTAAHAAADFAQRLLADAW